MEIKFYEASGIYKKIYELEKTALTAHAEAAEPGETTSLFEQDMARYLEAEAAVACASYGDACTALYSSFLNEGDEVIATVFCRSRAALEKCGAVIKNADVDYSACNISATSVLSAITEKTKAVVVTDIAGQTGEYEKLAEELKEKNILLIEEATEALCSHRMCREKICRAGSFCDAGLLSFAPGLDFSAEKEYGLIVLPVNNGRSDSLRKAVTAPDHEQSALLRARLRSCEVWAEDRRVLAERYMFMLGEKVLYRKITPPAETELNRHVYNRYMIQAENRDGLRKYMAEHGIETELLSFDEASHSAEALPASDSFIKNALLLPLWPGLPAEEQENVISVIADFYKEV